MTEYRPEGPIVYLQDRLAELLERAERDDEARKLASEALEELAAVMEELQAQNTELVASRANLEQERDRYRSLFDAVPDGYLITDELGTVREINATAVRLFDRRREALVGRPLATLVEPQDRRAFYALLSRLRGAKPGAHVSMNLLVRDGEPVPANLRAATAQDLGGGEPQIRWLIHDRRPDIVSRDLRINEERLRSLFDTATVGIVLTDADGAVMFANQRADEILGRPAGAVLRDAWLSSIHPDDVADVRAALQAALHGGRSHSMRHRIGAGSGETCWIDHGISPYRDRRGETIGVVSTITEVTQAHRAASALQDSRDFTDAVLDTVGALIIVLDPEGRVQRFNTACELLSGYSAEEMIGQRFVEILIPLEERDGVRDALAELAEVHHPNAHENDWITTDGTRRTISWTNTVLTDDHGAVRSIIGTGIDVTETRALEARLAQAARLESIGRLAAGIAHDFNNTLSILQLRLDRLSRWGDDDRARTDIQAATATIDRTKRVISDLLAFSRQQRLDPRPVDINHAVRHAAAILADLVGKNIVIELDLTDDPTEAVIDPGRFEQVLTNLIINGRDAMPEGGTISISTAIDPIAPDSSLIGEEVSAGGYVRVVVADTGVGIEPADVPNIFDPYFTTKPPGRGTGLGLATIYGTIKQSGGVIAVDSEPGVGTSFTLWLPQVSSEAPQESAPSTGAAPSLLVLVVEDQPDLSEVLIEELELLGYRTLGATSGEEALGLLGADIDLLITDVQLSGINGADLARRYSELRPGATTLFISGAPRERLRALLPPDAIVVPKPFTMNDLAAAIIKATSTST